MMVLEQQAQKSASCLGVQAWERVKQVGVDGMILE